MRARALRSPSRAVAAGMVEQPDSKDLLLSLASLRDPFGVLSLYVAADPGQQATMRAPWAIELDNGLREVRERVKSEGPRERWVRLAERLDELEPELARLIDAREPGRGRALFAPVGGGEVRRVSLQLPLPTCVVLEETAYLTPLVAAFDEGRPAGIVLLSQAGVRVLEERLGFVEELAAFELLVESGDWPEMKGPAAANPARGQQTAAQRDRYERRRDEQRARKLKAVVRELDPLVSDRGWDRLLIVGDPRLAQRVRDSLASFAGEAVSIDRMLDHLPAQALAGAVAAELERAARRRELALVEQATRAASSGGAGTLGLSQTLAALAEGRVAHLLFDTRRDYRGASAPDGRLVAEGTVPPNVRDDELTPEPRLAERMIERALATGARVTPLEGAPADALGDYEGVAALLRW